VTVEPVGELFIISWFKNPPQRRHHDPPF